MKNEDPKVTLVEYIFGFCSFIPLVGVLLGVISIVLGSLKFKSGGWKVVLLGSLGILFSIVLYSSLFFLTFGGKNNMITDMQKQMALGNLRQCVMNLEFYRQVHGAYPEKLETLADNQHPFNMGGAMLFDQTSGLLGNMKAQLFYYERTADGKGYFLLGRGPDGLPFTQDDVLPELSKEELTHCGFRKK